MNSANYSVHCPCCGTVVDIPTEWSVSVYHCDDCEIRISECMPERELPTEEEASEMAAYYEFERIMNQ